ncbi:hypothetical protein [Floccifex sp.]|uniref:hypothetical protein n=1 Tax=Floccifex sp. TaxID=2815810 RepID=UPI003F084C1C
MKIINLKGKKFGKLLVESQTEKRQNGSVIWRCICECGNTVDVSARKLTSGNTQSCGCIRKQNSGIKPVDLSGQKIGRLKVLSMTNKRSAHSVLWTCQCDCGNICQVSCSSLQSQKTLSCGCLREDSLKQNQYRVIKRSIQHQLRKNNSSGFIGVSYDRSTGKWMASIGINGKDYYLCRSKNKQYAIDLRQKAEEMILKPILNSSNNIDEEYIKNKIKEIRSRL